MEYSIKSVKAVKTEAKALRGLLDWTAEDSSDELSLQVLAKSGKSCRFIKQAESLRDVSTEISDGGLEGDERAERWLESLEIIAD